MPAKALKPIKKKQSLEELLGIKINKTHEELVREELELMAKNPPHWASSVYRPQALFWARAKGEMTNEEYEKAMSEYLRRRYALRDKIEKKDDLL